MPSTATESDLKQEVSDLAERFPNLKNHELFVAWFLRAYVAEDEKTAAGALVGASNDKGIDALYIDEDSRVVFVVQGKYRQKVAVSNETRSDVINFAGLAGILTSADRGVFLNFADGIDAVIRDRLDKARNRILRRNYKLKLYYVTTGKCSGPLRDEASKIVRASPRASSMDVIAGQQVLLLLADYLDGVAPPIPSLDLEMESGSSVQVNGTHQRFDKKTKIESWVFSMNGNDVADLFAKSGTRLFARNVRGFLGNTLINRGMEQTLSDEPEYFWYYNNGITIVCDGAQKISSKGRDVLKVNNPQVINGQQTTRTLHANTSSSGPASVLIKVIQVPRNPDRTSEHFDNLVSQIVACTNWQNAIRPSDLMSNDRRQIEIERHLRKIGYQYLRKRETKAEARKRAASRYRFLVKKEELAQAVAACELDPLVVRLGKENLFGEDLYSVVFPNSDPVYYLPRYWLMQRIASQAKGYPERAYAKWLVLNFVWQRLKPLVRTRKNAEYFWTACEKRSPDLLSLDKAINTAFRGALGMYRARRGKGPKAIDISTYFKYRERDKELKGYWKANLTYSNPFDNHWARFLKASEL